MSNNVRATSHRTESRKESREHENKQQREHENKQQRISARGGKHAQHTHR